MSEDIKVPDLYELAFMPGNFSCPKCGFQLSKVTINAALEKVGLTEENRQTEQCPNDGEWMNPLTYREAFEDYAEQWKKLFALGIGPIFHERNRQIEGEGWTQDHDDQHELGELSLAAVAYASPFPVKVKGPIIRPGHIFSEPTWADPWPWDEEFDKREKHDRIKRLTIAGALICAEIARLERKNAARTNP